MLKKPPVAVVSLCLCLFFAPVLAQAAPRGRAPRSEARLTVPQVLSVLETWWSVFFGGEERTGDTATPEKNGCGIDPNGKPLCGEDGGPTGGVTGANEDPTVGGTGG